MDVVQRLTGPSAGKEASQQFGAISPAMRDLENLTLSLLIGYWEIF
jgi:hypothetical protein